MSKSLNINFERAIRFLVKHMPVSDETSRKPKLFHVVRVGVYLYENGYSNDIVLAGLLHDTIEWASINQETLKKEFGEKILALVLANTKNDSIKDKKEKTDELIKRCISLGEDALVIKTADILDSFNWYHGQENINELKYCMRNANAILKYKPSNFNDKIFDKLKSWQTKLSNLSE